MLRTQLLVVQHSAEIAHMIDSVLDEMGFATTICTEPDGALESAVRLAPGVVLADLMMPGLDGREFCTGMTALGLREHLVVCSAWTGAEELAVELDLPFLGQPFDLVDLFAKVDAARLRDSDAVGV